MGSDAAVPDPPGHYFNASPETRSRRRTVPFVARFGGGDLLTDRGVFSPGRIDLGTRVLLDAVDNPPRSGTFLDLGCGYGPIAVALASSSPGAHVVAIDVNERARKLCAENLAERSLTNTRVCGPDEVLEDMTFDLIWSNPPIRVGKEALHEMLTRWLDRLTPDGKAMLVVQKNLGSESLVTWLERRGHPVERVKSKKGYRVLAVSPAAEGM